MAYPTHRSRGRPARLRWHVLLWLVLCAMVSLSAMALQGYHCARQAVLNLENTHLGSVLAARRARIADWIEERKSDLRSIAADPCVPPEAGRRTEAAPPWPSGDGGHAQGLACLTSPALGSIVFYDSSWRRIATAGSPLHTDLELAPESYRARVEQATDVVFSPAHTHGMGEIGIHLGMPMTTATGERLGFVVSSILLSDTLYPILEDRSGLRTSSKTYIAAPDGRFLSGPRPHTEPLSRWTDFPVGFLAGSPKLAATYRDCCGNTVLAMSSPMPEMGWVLVTEVDKAEAFAWLAVLRRRALGTGLLVLVGVLVLGLAGATSVARPFHQLRYVATRVAAGDHGERVARLNSAEAQEVAVAFNAMLDELAAYATKLANAGALAAVGQLSSSIVHEMRNPLSSIKLNLNAIREALPADSDDRELADIALQEAIRVEGMLNDLLAYGRPLELCPKPTPLSRLVQRGTDHARTACRERQVEIAVAWNGLEGAMPAIDEEQVLGALCNLIDNAVGFAPRGSSIELSVAVPPDFPHVLEIAVRDRGPGIRADHLARVFEPFFTTRDRGTGLGLAHVRKVVECHGGSVRAENHPDGGALFTIRLPAEEDTGE